MLKLLQSFELTLHRVHFAGDLTGQLESSTHVDIEITTMSVYLYTYVHIATASM